MKMNTLSIKKIINKAKYMNKYVKFYNLKRCLFSSNIIIFIYSFKVKSKHSLGLLSSYVQKFN